MKAILVLAAFVVSSTAFAALPPAVSKAASQMKSDSVRVRVKHIKPEGPCDSEYMAVIQIKQAAYDRINGKVVYTWEDVKTVGIDPDGRVMEVCAE